MTILEDALRASQANYADAIALLRTITAIDRGSGNASGLCKTANVLSNVLERMGCAVELHDDAAQGPTLIARRSGAGKKHIVMIAHMDTVWTVGTCEQRGFTMDEDYAYGPGVSDCSGGIIAAIYTLKTMLDLGWDDYETLTLLFNPDEEVSSPSSAKWIEACSKQADLCLCMECADNPDDYITRRAGGVYFEMRVQGVRAHAGVNPWDGRSAIGELVFKLNELQQIAVPDAYLNISAISGGSGACTVADNAYAMFRYRVDTDVAEHEVLQSVKRVAEHTFIDGTRTDIVRTSMGLPALVKNPGVDAYARILEQLSASFGRPMTECFCGGGADSGIACRAGTPTLCGLGPYGEGYHTEHERLSLAQIAPRVALLSAFIHEVCR